MTHHKAMKDKDYDLISTLYHALQGVEKCEGYLEDAEDSGDEGLKAFMKDTQQKYRDIADQAKALLSDRLG